MTDWHRNGNKTFGWAVVVLTMAIAAGVLGFGALAGIAALIARLLSVLGVVVFLVLVMLGGAASSKRAASLKRDRIL